LDVLRADYRLCHGFRRPEGAQGLPPLSCPIHVFGGRADRIAAAELQAWARETRGPSTLDWFDGGHFFLREEEDRFLRTLAERMTAPGATRGAQPLAATA
ncbi:thioesterase II family protein, partial [Paracidovorax cattleyae]